MKISSKFYGHKSIYLKEKRKEKRKQKKKLGYDIILEGFSTFV